MNYFTYSPENKNKTSKETRKKRGSVKGCREDLEQFKRKGQKT
jgi:hypothetical protein